MKEKNLLDVFENSARKLEQQPPERVWTELDQRLQRAGLRPKVSRRKSLSYLLRIGSIAASIALLVLLGEQFFGKDSHQLKVDVQGEVVKKTSLGQAPVHLENLLYDETQSRRVQGEIHMLYRRYKALEQRQKR